MKKFISLAGTGTLGLAFRKQAAFGNLFRSPSIEASIVIDFTNPEGTIEKAIYGQFIEHLRRAIKG